MEVIKKILFCSEYRRVLTLTSLCLVLLALSGCANLGPKHISMGRSDYNQAISKTDDEQMLRFIFVTCRKRRGCKRDFSRQRRGQRRIRP